MSDLEDRLAIHDLFVRYATALDQGEVETVVGCFAVDAALESPAIGRIQGTDAVRAFAARFAAQRAAGTQFRHLITNLAATIDPSGRRARASAYLLVMISEANAHRSLPPGRYECELAKEDGTWRFTRRVVFHDHEYTLDGI